MCGITGFFDPTPQRERAAQLNCLTDITSAIGHRGPDGAGVWGDEKHGIYLGHRRLAIVDLSETGAQPMASSAGRYVITFNGEIYNYADLRTELTAQGCIFRGTSDTEVLVEGFSRWGVEETMRRSVGMFALAVFDRQEAVLTLARDRAGEKPLYYGWVGNCFTFASELKALRKMPRWDGVVDREALEVFFRHSYIPAPLTIYRGVKKLPPGSMLQLQCAIARPGDTGYLSRYWDIHAIYQGAAEQQDERSFDDVVDDLDVLLSRSVRLQMVADVPLGAFLSGGIDSSTVVALMQQQSTRKVKTFTIGFQEQSFNEAVYAKRVAEHLGTEHTELYLSSQDALNVIPQIPLIYDEPFSDSSQIPTYLVAKLARSRVTVSLSGDGGDELFGGYERYGATLRLWQTTRHVPAPLRSVFRSLVRSRPPEKWEKLLGRVMNAFRPGWEGRTGDRLYRIADLVCAASIREAYLKMVTRSPSVTRIVRGEGLLMTELERAAQEDLHAVRESLSIMSYLDIIAYLPDDILTKVDRASMAVSLEGRMPFLDHRVIEYAARIPTAMKLRGGVGKWVLRRLLGRYVPESFFERPKMGFGVPIELWLRGPLKSWADELLDSRRLQDQGYLDAKVVSRMWSEHRSGRRRWHYELWDILMFQSWLDTYQ